MAPIIPSAFTATEPMDASGCIPTISKRCSTPSICNDRGEIFYLPVMLARLDDGRIFLESERDIYRKGTGGIDAVRALAQAGRIDTLIDWFRAGEVVNDQEGIAREVTLRSERAGGTPADPIAATTSEQARTVATRASRGLIAAALSPH